MRWLELFILAATAPTPMIRALFVPDTATGTADRVNYFVYDPLLFSGFTACGEKWSNMHSFKHSHFPLAYAAFGVHPWRVRDASSAEVFFVPVPVDALGYGHCSGNATQHILDMISVLEQQQFYHKKRHFLIAADFTSFLLVKQIRGLAPHIVIAKMTFPGMDHTELMPCTFSPGYLTFYGLVKASNWWAGSVENKKNATVYPSEDAIYRRLETFITFVGQLDGRSNYGDRVALMKSNGSFHHPVFIIAPHHVIRNGSFNFKEVHIPNCKGNAHDRCRHRFKWRETLSVYETSAFSLNLRGDSAGSDRWMNSLMALCIPVAVGDRREVLDWLPFAHAIAWEEIIVRIERNTFRNDPVKALSDHLEGFTEKDILRFRKQIFSYLPHFDWGIPGSMMATNFLISAKAVKCGSSL